MVLKSRCRGFILIELMIAIVMISLILPVVLNVTSLMIQKANIIIKDRQASIERIDFHQRLQLDAWNGAHRSTDCCLETQDHVICYDIKNNRVRRRKRQWENSRFYSHYIGQKALYTHMKCQSSGRLLMVTIHKLNGQPMDWVFILGAT